MSDDAEARLRAESYDWMPEAQAAAAQCWCDPETSGKLMDTVLAEAVARRIAAWMQTGAMFARNEAFYRGLIDKCAEHLGLDAFTADDGSIHDSPMRLKVPELVAERIASLASARRDLDALTKQSAEEIRRLEKALVEHRRDLEAFRCWLALRRTGRISEAEVEFVSRFNLKGGTR